MTSFLMTYCFSRENKLNQIGGLDGDGVNATKSTTFVKNNTLRTK